VVEIFKIKISAFWCILKCPARWGSRLAGGTRYIYYYFITEATKAIGAIGAVEYINCSRKNYKSRKSLQVAANRDLRRFADPNFRP